MAAPLLVLVYVVIGCGAAIAVWVERLPLGQSKGGAAAALMLVFWPFFLPGLLTPEPGGRPKNQRRADGIEALGKEVQSAWTQAGVAGEREQALLAGFVEQLVGEEDRLAELEASLSAAPERVRPRLLALKEEGEAELAAGRLALEELGAQLLLWRFAGKKDGAERITVDELVARIEALASLEATTGR
ncbi:MAG: hypothetical protein IPG45_14965 [Deltaproteobacteria bacterium]|jgi:hypothetical protein|nr:hypothetical protein [Deltaproteobacteria bacterium]